MDLAALLIAGLAYTIANLVLISAGLAIIFGMMRVINLAHGEFMVLGGYATIVLVEAGVNIFFAMLVVAPLVVGVIGLVIERIVIRHLYGQLIATMLATWGISLLIIGLITMVFGNTITGVSTPITAFSIGEFRVNGYNFFITLVAAALVIGIYVLFKTTRIGLVVRGTMQQPEIAAALGYSPDRIYMLTFFIGSALSGLAGAVLAPLVGLVPTAGGAYIAKAFITVIVGGPSVIVGMLSSATLFGTINQFFTFLVSPVVGEVALLVAAVILLRLMPRGITGRFFRGRI